MSNPQLTNGYIRITTTIMEALAKIRIPGEARQVLDVILRKTYGFQKKFDYISLNQFSLSTGLKKPAVVRAINKLLAINLIIKKDNNLYGFQKNYDHWKPLSKKITVIKKDNLRYQKSKSALSKKITFTDDPKDTITKDNITKDNNTPPKSPPKTQGGESAGSNNKPKQTNNLQKVVLAYKILKGYAKDDKKWDKLYFKRFSRPASQLLNFFNDSWQTAVRCIEELGKDFDKKGLSWTLDTIVRWAAEWELRKEKDNAGESPPIFEKNS